MRASMRVPRVTVDTPRDFRRTRSFMRSASSPISRHARAHPVSRRRFALVVRVTNHQARAGPRRLQPEEHLDWARVRSSSTPSAPGTATRLFDLAFCSTTCCSRAAGSRWASTAAGGVRRWSAATLAARRWEPPARCWAARRAVARADACTHRRQIAGGVRDVGVEKDRVRRVARQLLLRPPTTLTSAQRVGRRARCMSD